MDIGKSFSFVFEDDRWITKILIAVAILAAGLLLFWVLFIPTIIALALLLGYSLEITRRVINHTQPVLPEWDDWQKLIIDGLKVLVISIVYSLPGILISVCLGTPAGILQDQSSDASFLGVMLSLTASCLSFLWSLVITLLLPAAIAFFAVDGQISSAFRFSDVIAFVRQHIQTYLVVLVISWVAGLVAGVVGFAVCGIGLLATIPYYYMVVGHLYGQAYSESRGGAVAPVAGTEA